MVGAGPALIAAIHPLAMDRRFWQWLRVDLAIDATWMLFDLPGHGASPPAGGEYGVEDVAEAVAAALNGRGRAHVIGASLGGMVAMVLAALHPYTTRSIILADSTPRYAEDFGWEERATAALAEGMAPLVENTLHRWFTHPEGGGPEVEYVRDRLSDIDPEAYALACRALGRADLTGLLHQIDVPALVIAGDADVLADDCRRLAASLPRAVLRWLPDAKHGAPLEQRRLFATQVAGFLKSSEPGPADD